MTTKPVCFNGKKMIAHRGVSAMETENSNAAFVAAGNRTYWGIETDVHRTKDGKFIIILNMDKVLSFEELEKIAPTEEHFVTEEA